MAPRHRSPRPGSALPALAATLVALLAAGCGGSAGSDPGSSTSSPGRIDWVTPARAIPGLRQRTVGSGARGAVVLWPAGSRPPRDVVIFFHGWQADPPSAEARWIAHLAEEGNTVIYPAYRSADSTPEAFLEDASAGVAAAFAYLRRSPGAVVAIGRTTGGALAFDYAASAGGEGLPVPAAVFAVFPGRRPPDGVIPDAGLGRIPPATELEAIAGPGDPLPGGEAEARALLGAAVGVPRRDRRVLRPQMPPDLARLPVAAARAAERRAIWAPADLLIAGARPRAPSQ